MNAQKNLRLWLALLVFALLPFSLVQAQEDAEAAHRDALNRLGTEWLLQGDNAVLEEFVADDYVVHSPLGDLNRDAVSGLFAAIRAALTDMEVTRDNLVVEGDVAALRSVITGTFENEFNGGAMGIFPPTGLPFRWETINIFRFNNAGQIQEEWVQSDVATLMAQLGAMPAPAASATEEATEAAGGITEEFAAHFAERFDAMFDGPNLDIADEILAPEFVSHLPLAPELDLEAFKAYIASFYEGISDITQETHQVIVADDRVVIHVTYNGTHDGTLFGIPATGNPISMNGIGIFSFNEEGLATENWAVIDVVAILAQIGAFPPAAPAE